MKASLLALGAMAALVTARPHVGNITRALFGRNDQASFDQQNFAGIVWDDGYDNILAVSGEMVVPGLNYIEGGPETQGVAFWVGIAGTYCGGNGNELLQTGITGSTSGNGVQWSAFAEWADYAPSQEFENFVVNTGDKLSFQVILNSPTTGTANVANTATGQKVSMNLSGPEVCASAALWLVEDFEATNNFSNAGLADFGTVFMTDALAIADGQYFNAGDGGAWYMVQNGQKIVNADSNVATMYWQYLG